MLKKDLDAATEAKSKSDKQLETARNALKERALHDQELKTKCDEDKAKREQAESELAELQSQSAGWLNELKLINRQMTHKSFRISDSGPLLALLSELLIFLSLCRGVWPN